MPYLASLRDLIVRPSDFRIEFDRDDDLECPHCEREMVFKKCDGRADHFAHTPDSVDQSSNTGGGGGVGGCEHAGESETHELMKKKAITALQERFSGFTSIELEKTFDKRRADVVATFEEPHDIYGKGICVEVQYRNDSKAFIATSGEYNNNDYSVCWVFYNDWETLFEVKNELQHIYNLPLYFGHIESLEDEFNIGEPLPPLSPGDYKESIDDFANPDSPYTLISTDGWKTAVEGLRRCVQARCNGKVHPQTPPPNGVLDAVHEFFMKNKIKGEESIPRRADDRELQSVLDTFRDLTPVDVAYLCDLEQYADSVGDPYQDRTSFLIACVSAREDGRIPSDIIIPTRALVPVFEQRKHRSWDFARDVFCKSSESMVREYFWTDDKSNEAGC